MYECMGIYMYVYGCVSVWVYECYRFMSVWVYECMVYEYVWMNL